MEPQEEKRDAGSGLARLLVAERAGMQICIQGKMTKPPFFELSEMAKGQEREPSVCVEHCMMGNAINTWKR